MPNKEEDDDEEEEEERIKGQSEIQQQTVTPLCVAVAIPSL